MPAPIILYLKILRFVPWFTSQVVRWYTPSLKSIGENPLRQSCKKYDNVKHEPKLAFQEKKKYHSSLPIHLSIWLQWNFFFYISSCDTCLSILVVLDMRSFFFNHHPFSGITPQAALLLCQITSTVETCIDCSQSSTTPLTFNFFYPSTPFVISSSGAGLI